MMTYLYRAFAGICLLTIFLVSTVPGCAQPATEPIAEQTQEAPKEALAEQILPQEAPAPDEPTPTDAAPPEATMEPVVEEVAKESAPEPIQETPVVEEAVQEATPEPIAEKKPVDPTAGDAEACKTLTTGPFKQLMLTTEASQAKEVFLDHFGYQFVLKKGEFSFFKFNAFTQRDHYFYFDQDVPFSAQDAKATLIPNKNVEKQVGQCQYIKVKYTVNLPDVSYYYLKVGPVTQDTTVSIAVYDGHDH